MRPLQTTKAHKTGKCAELVCSNSFRGRALTNAVGLLKAELRVAGSLVIEAALYAEVPAGGALAVDREIFSAYIDHKIRSHPLIDFQTAEQITIPSYTQTSPVIIATGPLTSKKLSEQIQNLTGQSQLAFFDAISPILLAESIDFGKLFRASRYGKGGGDDYWNIPLTLEQYTEFVSAVAAGEKFGGHEEVEADDVSNLRPFEGCMPIEEMIARGPETLRFGPMKPTGLTDPQTGRWPYAVVQLRQDDQAGELWSIVGFQTRLRHGEQQRIFRSLPGLEQAEFIRLGTVHRNTFLNSPTCLSATLEMRNHQGLFFAGQITGVEGYVESTAGGLVAGINAARVVAGNAPITFPVETAIGALMQYISDPQRKDFQPMNISFGLMPSYFTEKSRSKDERRTNTSKRALSRLAEFLDENELSTHDCNLNELPTTKPLTVRHSSLSNQSGIALLLTIFIITLATVIVVDFGYIARFDARALRSYQETIQAEYSLKSALNLARVLIEMPKLEGIQEDWLGEPWALISSEKSLPISGVAGELRLSIIDEDGKIDLNSLHEDQVVPASPNPFDQKPKDADQDGEDQDTDEGEDAQPPPQNTNALFWKNATAELFKRSGFIQERYDPELKRVPGNVGFSPSNQVAVIQDWIDANKESYQSTAFTGKGIESEQQNLFFNRPLKTISDLLLVPGMTKERISRVAQNVKVSTSSGVGSRRVNINTAPLEVLIALGFPETEVVDLVQKRLSLPINDGLLSLLLQGDSQLRQHIKTTSNEFSVIVRAVMPNCTRWLRAIVTTGNPGTQRQTVVRSIEIY